MEQVSPVLRPSLDNFARKSSSADGRQLGILARPRVWGGALRQGGGQRYLFEVFATERRPGAMPYGFRARQKDSP
jgi:hypothetical protein